MFAAVNLLAHGRQLISPRPSASLLTAADKPINHPLGMQ